MKHPIRQSDKLRAILTDLVPYEVPLRFSFLHIHRALSSQTRMPYWTNRLFDKAIAPKSCLPYLYSIKRSEKKKRTLGLIHPLALQDAAVLYSEYDGIIVSLCSKSSWSLRRPVRTAKMYFAREERPVETATSQAGAGDEDDGPQGVGLPAEVERVFQENASSYFVYEPFNLLQKFFESKELLAIERRFARCRRLDVAKCFDNIYSHSVSWAIKGKASAKSEKACGHTFDARIDAFMQRSNHRETHGILIGSELSRIFAEIILQDIDARTKEQLQRAHAPNRPGSEGKNTLHDGREFTVRRYIDDYFVFYNDDRVADEVQSALESQLAAYKLFLNEKKTSDTSRPFITTISAAKREAHKLFAEQLDFDVNDCSGDGQCGSPLPPRRFRSTKILCSLRLILSKLEVTIADTSASLLKQLSIIVNKKLVLFKAGHASIAYASDWLRCVLDIVFYLFAVDIRFRTSVLVGRIVSDLTESFPLLPVMIANDAEDVILRESLAILNQVVETRDSCRLEMANFLICLRGLRQYWRIPESLVRFLGTPPIGEQKGLDYFLVVSLLYFVGDRAEYRQLQAEIVTGAVARVDGAVNLIDETELVSLSLDLLSCPWVPRASKDIIANRLMKSLGTPNPSAGEVDAFVNEFARTTWLFDWRSTVSNSIYLQKKELSLSY